MQAELKVVQQQALATQHALQQLEARKPADAFTAISSNIAGLSIADGAILGAALALAAAVVWWYVGHRTTSRTNRPGA